MALISGLKLWEKKSELKKKKHRAFPFKSIKWHSIICKKRNEVKKKGRTEIHTDNAIKLN